ncbi:MAG TPA: bacterial transcriptional activator domain-containing protein, partial [Tepidisphaeraceae bacterium]|nr:bacterial transcriptional activator domain-containing protein [Tepidisphaeraceae bacterium]
STPARSTRAPLAAIIVAAAVALAVLAAPGPAVGAPDPLLEAKRKAAAELLKDGKTAEAVALLEEVQTADPHDYRDPLALARAYEKLNRNADAVESYRRVLDLTASATGAADRNARVEAERRVKVLDAQTQKIQAAEDEFLRKLDTLERDAIAAKDARAVGRVFRLKAGVYRAAGRTDHLGTDVQANQPWQESGLVVRKGATYRVRAVGTTRFKGAPATPDGTGKPSANTIGPIGLLVGLIEGASGADQAKIGSSGQFTADRSGKLLLSLNADAAERKGAEGSVTVLIERTDR